MKGQINNFEVYGDDNQYDFFRIRYSEQSRKMWQLDCAAQQLIEILMHE